MKIATEAEVRAKIASFLENAWDPNKRQDLGPEEYNSYLYSLFVERSEHIRKLFDQELAKYEEKRLGNKKEKDQDQDPELEI